MGFLDTIKRLLSGETISMESNSNQTSHKSSRTSTVNGVTTTTTIEIQELNNDWTYIVNGTLYKTLADIPERERQQVQEVLDNLKKSNSTES